MVCVSEGPCGNFPSLGFMEDGIRRVTSEKNGGKVFAKLPLEMARSILLDNPTILCKSSFYGTRIIRESTEIQLRDGVINKEDGARLSKAWLPALDLLTERYSYNLEIIK